MSPNRQGSTSHSNRMLTRSMSSHSNEDEQTASAAEKEKIPRQMIDSGNRIGKREGPNFAARIRQEGKKLPPKRLESIIDLFQEIEVADKSAVEMSGKKCSNCQEMSSYLYESKNDEDYMETTSPEGICNCYTSKTSIVKYTECNLKKEDIVSPVYIEGEEWTNVLNVPCRIVQSRTSKQWTPGPMGIKLQMSNRKHFDCWMLTGSQTAKRVYMFSHGNDRNRKFVTVNDRNKLVLRHDDSPHDINVDTNDEIGDRRAFYEESDSRRNVEGNLLVPAFKPTFAISQGTRHLKIKEKNENSHIWKILLD